MVCEILSVGTELLMGQVANTDAQYISQRLTSVGITVYRHTVVGDNAGRLDEALETALLRSDMVITTGGLGPTEDDLTKETVAQHFSLKLVEDAGSLENLMAFQKRIGRPITQNNFKQALIPEGSIVMPNRVGTAPGCIIEKDNKTVAVLPGPPSEMKDMFENCLFPYLQKKSGQTLVSRYLHIFGIGESTIETQLQDLFHLGSPTLALYCSTAECTARISVMCALGEDPAPILDPVENEIRRRLGNAVYAEGLYEDLPGTVLKMLKAQGKTVSFAESCTGGMLSSSIVDLSGASEVFSESYITYSNDAKRRLLGVREETLLFSGAVSRACAQEMAYGTRKNSGSDYALSITGIAGPDGGTAEKPVGLVYIGLADREGAYAHEFRFHGNRTNIRTASVKHALNLLRLTLINKA
ncbi:MAG: competence/damage-inducible protein A [Clostridia bacterium]|nr:competence/damage-inducible protein A [Clostridia bacterium]